MPDLNIIIVVFARNDSKRLHKKHFKKIGSYTVLEHLYLRSLLIKKSNDIILATTKRKVDDELAKYAKNIGYSIFRGSYKDVLKRFYNVFNEYNSNFALKINGDCPFISYELSNLLIEQAIKTNSDFISAKGKLVGCPIGLGPEIFSKNGIKELHKKTPLKYRESISGFIFEKNNNLILKKTNLILNKKYKFKGRAFTLDNIEDLNFLKNFWKKLSCLEPSEMTMDIIKKNIT